MLHRPKIRLRQFIVCCCLGAGTCAEAQLIEFKMVNPKLSNYGYVEKSARWQQRTIPVCFENPSVSLAKQQLLVESAVESTWEKAAAIQFTGWRKCRTNSSGIRILISDDDTPPHSLYGNKLDGVVNGMKLNFTFKNWGKSCVGREDECIFSIAVHEFGHAIGFVHESLRSDAPEDCKARKDVIADGSDPGDAETVTPYDPDSVMNYCNFIWNAAGKLSLSDIEAAKILYPGP